MELKDYWDSRVDNYGHTGWANGIIYSFDQSVRIGIVENLIERWGGERKCLLDFGCGSGDFSADLSKEFKEIVLYDISEKVLKVAFERVANSYAISNLYELESIQKKYDAIISVTVLQHIMDDDELKEIIDYFSNNLNDDGVVVVLESYIRQGTAYYRKWTTEEMIGIFSEFRLEPVYKANMYLTNIFEDVIFCRYMQRLDVFFYYHVWDRLPYLRKWISRRVDKIVSKLNLKMNSNQFVYKYTDDSGLKIIVFKKRKV